MKNQFKTIFLCLIILMFGTSFGFQVNNYLLDNQVAVADDLSMDEQELTVRAINTVMPAVVSIVVYDQEDIVNIDFSTGQETITTERVKKGSGTGFLISADGLILTNKHVVEASSKRISEIKVIMNDGKQYDANLIDKDPLHDLAVLQIGGNSFPYVELGDSDNLPIGTTVIAIGNSLGLYQNSATKGIVSGLNRSLIAADTSGNSESFENLIQVDADINPGNSGGPLIDLDGNLVGVNVATDQGGTGIGFAIPVNDVRGAIQSVKETSEIIRPKIGIRYLTITPDVVTEFDLPRNDGALIVNGENGEPGILPDSPAAGAGLQAGDIIYEINAIPLNGNNTLFSVVQKYKPGEKIGLKIQRGSEIFVKVIVLGEFR